MHYNIIVICFCIAIALIDLITYRIPDVLLASFALIIIITEGSQPYMLIAARLAVAALSFFLFAIIWFHSKGLGFGDVKYASLLGYMLGFERLIMAFLYTAVLCMAVFLVGIILFRWPKTTKIPFAPFMSAGAVMAIAINLNAAGGVL